MIGKLPINCILSFCREQVPGHGEDSFCYASCDTAVLLAAFDGCGGAGAQTHKCYDDHSEAYIASRLCAGVVYDDFCELFPTAMSTEEFVKQKLTQDLKQVLEENAPFQEEGAFQIRGSLVRTLPTTAAMAMVRPENGGIQLSAIWAGDSRVYLLNGEGLAQLTVDDTTVPDPMENLYEDGVLKNVICKDRPVRLRCASYRVKPPFVVFAATDGCFGYVTTPMEFEEMLLSTLAQSESPAQWEEALAGRIGGVAGDDYTLCLAAFGYESFEDLRSEAKRRYAAMNKAYLDRLSELPSDDREGRRLLWESYSPNYCRYLKDGM